MGRKALVTGASGFVGSYLCPALISNGYEVHSLSETRCDIRDYQSVQELISRVQPQLIYHLAAMSFVPACQADLDKTIAVNVSGTHNLLKASMESGLRPKMIFISTANLYGKVSADQIPITEATKVQPENNYALSKYMAEAVVQMYARETDAETVIFRPFNHIGPGQLDKFVVSSFAKQLIEIKKGMKEPVMAVGNLSPKRDFTDVRDIVRAYVSAGEVGSGIYNLCSDTAYSIQDLLDRLIKISGVECSVERDQERYRKNDLPVLSGNPAKAYQDLGWEAEIALDQSLEDILDYWDAQLTG